jgi:hypothetical protein
MKGRLTTAMAASEKSTRRLNPSTARRCAATPVPPLHGAHPITTQTDMDDL